MRNFDHHNTFEFDGLLAFTIWEIAYINHLDINIEHVNVPIFYFLSFFVFFQFCKCIDAWTSKDSYIIIVLFSAFKTKKSFIERSEQKPIEFPFYFLFQSFLILFLNLILFHVISRPWKWKGWMKRQSNWDDNRKHSICKMYNDKKGHRTIIKP